MIELIKEILTKFIAYILSLYLHETYNKIGIFKVIFLCNSLGEKQREKQEKAFCDAIMVLSHYNQDTLITVNKNIKTIIITDVVKRNVSVGKIVILKYQDKYLNNYIFLASVLVQLSVFRENNNSSNKQSCIERSLIAQKKFLHNVPGGKDIYEWFIKG
ncbi:MAG: hypothetical protein WC299_02400 [Kiritimatiellia bacterium]